MISVAVVDQQNHLQIAPSRIKQAVEVALESAGVHQARMTVALIDDAHIRRLNRQFLQEDESTDVLSFPMGRVGQRIEGEIVVSAERAVAVAEQYGWKPEEELLLYIIHGALHLAGFDDTDPTQRRRMRQQELLCLRRLGIQMPGKGRPKPSHPTATSPGRSCRKKTPSSG